MPVRLDTPVLADVLGQAHQLYLAIATSGGPLVTPELYGAAGGRLWCATARSTAKARLTHDGDAVGVAATLPGRTAVIVGRVTVFDAVRPHRLLARPAASVGALGGAAAFTGRNALELAGAVRDALAGRLGRIPEPRLLLGIEPEAAVAVVGDELREVHGSWPPPQPPPVAPAPARRGAASAASADGHVATVVGWMAGGRPLALPATWSSDEGVARIPASLFDAVGADPAGPACLCFDRWSGLGPSGKHGQVVRGPGSAAREGDEVALRVDAERVTAWRGVGIEPAPR